MIEPAGLSYVTSFLGSIPFALQISLHSFSANVIDSTYASNFAMLVLSECQIPRRFAPGTIQLTSFSSLRF